MGWALTPLAVAQKGMGEETGVGRQRNKPDVVQRAGTIRAVETHACGKTTGKAPLGTHLSVEDAEGRRWNLHLGPAEAVAPMVKSLSGGETGRFDVFRTDKMPAGHYVVVAMEVDDKTYALRDASRLRPFWADGARSERGRGKRKGGQAWYAPRKRGPCWW